MGGKRLTRAQSIFEAKVFPPPFRAAEIEESFLFSSLSKMDSQARFMTSLENAVFELEVRTKCGHKWDGKCEKKYLSILSHVLNEIYILSGLTGPFPGPGEAQFQRRRPLGGGAAVLGQAERDAQQRTQEGGGAAGGKPKGNLCRNSCPF